MMREGLISNKQHMSLCQKYGFVRYSISEMADHFEKQIGHGSGIGKYLGSGRVLGTCWALLMIHRTQKV